MKNLDIGLGTGAFLGLLLIILWSILHISFYHTCGFIALGFSATILFQNNLNKIFGTDNSILMNLQLISLALLTIILLM